MIRIRLLLAGLMGAALVAAGGWIWHLAAERAAWARNLPAVPELAAALPAEFGERVAILTARVEAARDVAALGELARLYHANGMLREAAIAYVTLERFDAANARWPHLLAHLLAGMGRVEEAERLWRRAIDRAPDYGPARVWLGDARFKSGAPEEAGAAYTAALEIEPGNAYALLGLARVEIQRGRWSVARERLQQAVAARPDFGAAWHLLATVYQLLGNATGATAAQAHADGQRRFREMPDPWWDDLLHECYDPYRLRVAASAAQAAGESAEAVRWLERAVELAPESATAHRELGRMLTDQGTFPRARRELEHAIALAPADEAGHLALIENCTAAGDPAGVAAAITAGVERCPAAASLQFAWGRHLAAAGRGDEALAAFAAARRLRPDAPEAYHESAGIHFRRGQEREGIAALEAFLEQVPDHPETVQALAQRAIETGDEAAARRWLARGRASGGAITEAWIHLGRLYRQRFGRAPW